MEVEEPPILTRPTFKREGKESVQGVLTITESRLAWRPDDPAAAKPLVIERSTIQKTQRAPTQPFMRLETPTGPVVFGFSTLDERNLVVDTVAAAVAAAAAATTQQQATSAASGGTSSGKVATGPAAERKRELLTENRDLRTLYDQLVNSGLLSEAEFWQSRQHLLKEPSSSAVASAARAGGSSAGGSAVGSSKPAPAGGAPAGPNAQQLQGLPTALLADVRAAGEGQGHATTIKLTAAAMQQIFRERPEVLEAYQHHVPRTLSAKEFWSQYFRLELKRAERRQKLVRAGKLSSTVVDDDEDFPEDELFAPFRRRLAEQEQQRLKAELSRVDPTVNLAADAGDRLGGGFGTLGARDPECLPRQRPTAQQRVAGGGEGLAYYINRHGAFVLAGVPDELGEISPTAELDNEGRLAAQVAAALAAAQKKKAKAQAAAAPGGSSGAGGGKDEVPPERLQEWERRAASGLDDLRHDDYESRFTKLSIQDPRLYFGGAETTDEGQEGGAGGLGLGSGGKPAGAEDVRQALAAIDPTSLHDPPCPPALAAQVVLELSQEEDAALVAEFGPVAATAMGRAPQEVVLDKLLELLRDEALKTNELLRHFWGAVPIISAPRQQKAAKICRALEEQRKRLQAHMTARPGTLENFYINQILRPLAAAVDAALGKHREEVVLLQKSQGLTAAAVRGAVLE